VDIEALLELVKNRRHNGRLRTDPVPDEFLEKLITAACWAPSGNNAQPWEFIVVRSEEGRTKIREILEGSARQAPSPAPAADPPVIIVVCGDTRFKESFPEAVIRDEVFHSSLAAATQNLHLAAAALGLATTWGTVRKNAMAPLHDLLNLPEELEIVALVRVGYPQEIPPPRPRRSAGEAMHWEKFDGTRLRNVETFIQTYGRGWGRL